MNELALFNLSYGLYIISTLDGNRPTGCIANCAMQITAEPSTLAISINRKNLTSSCIEKSGKFAISILPEDFDPQVIRTFGYKSGRDTDKFYGTAYTMIGGMPVMENSCAYILCDVIKKVDVDTHIIYLAKITDCENMMDKKPMTYAYYYDVLKGKSAKNAPTYIDPSKYNKEQKTTEKEEKKMEQYVCKVCGYVYDGEEPFENLPEDWLCPICGEPKSEFEKQ